MALKRCKGEVCRVLRFWPLIDVIFPLSPHLRLGNTQCPLDQKLKNLTYLHTYFLSPWSRALLEKLTCSQLVKKFPTFYRTQRFITAFTSVRHLSISWARSVHAHPSHFLKIHLNIILPSTPDSSKWSVSLMFPYQNLAGTSSSPNVLRASPIPSSWFDHPNYIWWGVQIIKLHIM